MQRSFSDISNALQFVTNMSNVYTNNLMSMDLLREENTVFRQYLASFSKRDHYSISKEKILSGLPLMCIFS